MCRQLFIIYLRQMQVYNFEKQPGLYPAHRPYNIATFLSTFMVSDVLLDIATNFFVSE